MTAHPPVEALEAEALTPEVAAHLATCPRCRTTRRMLQPAPPTVAPEAPDSGTDPLLDWLDPVPQLDRLAAGTLVGRYAVDGFLGRGGMAVVYRVRHRDLGGYFALKVLRTPDGELARRLLREGRTQARVRHPNVVGVVDWVQTPHGPGLVLEYVPGPSLRDLLEATPVSPEVAEALALDVLAGVGAAHTAGLVHRDLKPANVLLEITDGALRARVADFGLAKANVPVDSLHTRASVVAGTPRYMAPEAFDGARDLDARSDVFSLGALLYELVTGEPAFVGPDRTPPAPVPDRVPERVAAAIEAALAHDPAERPADANALAASWMAGASPAALAAKATWPVALLDEARALAAVEPLPESAPTTLPEAAPRPPNQWGALAIGVGLGLVALFLVLRPARAPFDGLPFVDHATASEASELDPDFASDGRSYLFSDGTDVWVRRVSGERALRLTGDFEPPAEDPVWSPDEQRIAFASEGSVWVMGAAGEDPRELVDRGVQPAWSPDGRAIAYATTRKLDWYVNPTAQARIEVVDVASGHRHVVYADDDNQHPAWSPDGRWIAFSNSDGPAVARPDGTGFRFVAPATTWMPVWAADGDGLYVLQSRGSSYGVMFVPTWPVFARWSPQELFTVANVPRRYTVHEATRSFLVGQERPSVRTWRIPFDPTTRTPTGPARPVTPADRALTSPAVAADGRVVYAAQPRDRDSLVVQDPDGTLHTLLDPGRVFSPSWLPDSAGVVFQGKVEGDWGVFAVHADGTRLRRVSDETLTSGWQPRLAPDGTRILYTISQAHVVDLDAPWTPQIEAQTRASLDWTVGLDFQPGTDEVAVRDREGQLRMLDVPAGTLGPELGPVVDGRFVDPTHLLVTHQRGVDEVTLPGGARRRVLDLPRGRVFPGPGLAIGPDALYVTVWETRAFLERVTYR
ncbi:MAG: protein kinase [Myxococcota bacterium]